MDYFTALPVDIHSQIIELLFRHVHVYRYHGRDHRQVLNYMLVNRLWKEQVERHLRLKAPVSMVLKVTPNERIQVEAVDRYISEPSNEPELPKLTLSAANLGLSKVVARLVAAGVSPNITDGPGRSILHFAVKSGSSNTVQVLLDAGAEIDDKATVPIWGFGMTDAKEDYYAFKTITPLGLAVQGHNPAIVKELLQRGANMRTHTFYVNPPDPREADPRNWELLPFARHHNHAATAKILQEYGAPDS